MIPSGGQEAFPCQFKVALFRPENVPGSRTARPAAGAPCSSSGSWRPPGKVFRAVPTFRKDGSSRILEAVAPPGEELAFTFPTWVFAGGEGFCSLGRCDGLEGREQKVSSGFHAVSKTPVPGSFLFRDFRWSPHCDLLFAEYLAPHTGQGPR